MITLKCWHFVCLLFFAYSLAFLSFVERYEVSYVADDAATTEPLNKMVCGDLNAFYPKKAHLKLGKLRKDLAKYWQKLLLRSKKRDSFYPEKQEWISKRIKTEDHFILFGFLCFIANDLMEINLILELLKIRKSPEVIFVF